MSNPIPIEVDQKEIGLPAPEWWNDLSPRDRAQRLAELNNIGRNDLCPCGSGKKYKQCCM